jgi:hypothetical protein
MSGAMQLTRMPSLPTSTASDLVNADTPALNAE